MDEAVAEKKKAVEAQAALAKKFAVLEEDLKLTIAETRAALSEKSSEVLLANEALSQMRGQYQELNSRYDYLIEEKRTLHEQAAKSKEEITRIESDLEQAMSSIRRLEDEIDRKTADALILSNEFEDYKETAREKFETLRVHLVVVLLTV